ncbi:hypothetical protein L3Q82_006814 [Scortum barcoo]|uniref:Uncharacterized protein n=1 Tax=Scortum barcoo TaxID=214431 RepID=A0ACB8WVZ0_9TELE|nr:hypothetical protein L3Q82_006814 [Scortum barcoo]
MQLCGRWHRTCGLKAGTVVQVKKELSRKAKLSIYQVNLTLPPSPMVMNFGVAGRSLRDRVRSSVTFGRELGVEPLLLHMERSQLRWLGHLFRMPPGRLPREVFQACPTGRRPRGRPRTRWRDYVSQLAWERLGVPREELEEESGNQSQHCCLAGSEASGAEVLGTLVERSSAAGS